MFAEQKELERKKQRNDGASLKMILFFLSGLEEKRLSERFVITELIGWTAPRTTDIPPFKKIAFDETCSTNLFSPLLPIALDYAFDDCTF